MEPDSSSDSINNKIKPGEVSSSTTTTPSTSNNDENGPKPIQIVGVNPENGQFELNLEALSSILLRDTVKDKPVAVLSIAGDFRKGKSFLLNFFIRYFSKNGQSDWLDEQEEPLKGFSWRGGSERDTTGILMWSEPFIVKSKDKEIALLLMDTQGAFDSEYTIRDSATVFALSTMTSSIQIFNLLHNLQEDNLQVLEIFTEYGKLALETSDIKPFQKLMFLIRDWSYPYEHDYGLKGGQCLLDKKLEIRPNQPAQLQRVRRNIRGCFSNIECYLMPHPGNKVTTSPQFDGRLKDIEPSFLEYLSILVPLLVSPDNIIVKNIGGEEVNGRQLMEYFKVYTSIFRGETMPEPKSMLEATAEANNLAAIASAKDLYMSSMEQLCGGNKPFISPNSLQKKHEQYRQDALECFQQVRKMGGKEFSETYIKQLEEEIGNAFNHFSSQNQSKNMFNLLGSTLILLIWSLTLYISSKVFEAIFLPLSNLLFLGSTFSFALLVTYITSKIFGTLPEIVITVDAMVTQVHSWIQDSAFQMLHSYVEQRMLTGAQGPNQQERRQPLNR